MQHDWILGVLADLKTFAKANGLGDLATQLERATLVAAADIASNEGKAAARINGEQGRFGSDTGGVGRHNSA